MKCPRRVPARVIPEWAVAWVAAWSALAFLAAVVDKSRARRRKWRVPERTLLALAAVGGSPGLVLAMLLVRHKTRKRAFLVPLAGILLAQGVALALVVRSP